MANEDTRKVKAQEESTKKEVSEKELEKVVGGARKGGAMAGLRR